MTNVDTPTLDRIMEIQESAQLCGEFFEWLKRRYVLYDKNIKRDSPFVDVMRDSGDYINIEKLLAEFFDIDLMEADREKAKIIEALKESKSDKIKYFYEFVNKDKERTMCNNKEILLNELKNKLASGSLQKVNEWVEHIEDDKDRKLEDYYIDEENALLITVNRAIK